MTSSHHHVVGFYDQNEDFVAGVGPFVLGGIERNESIVAVITEGHRDALVAELERRGADPGHLVRTGRLLWFDAAQMLGALVIEDRVDPDRFAAVVGGLIDRASPEGGCVCVLGEMVGLLFDQGNVRAAVALESLWNDLGRSRSFSLHCAYGLSSLAHSEDLVAADEICSGHSEVLAPPAYASGQRWFASPAASLSGEQGDTQSQLFVPVSTAVGAARRFVNQALMAWDETDLIDNASLVVSELATNALRHARTPFRASITRSGTDVTIEVHDANQAPPRPGSVDAMAPGGRGITLVKGHSTRWGTYVNATGKVVWSELGRPVLDNGSAGPTLESTIAEGGPPS